MTTLSRECQPGGMDDVSRGGIGDLMGRIRTIKPEFFRSRSLAKVSIPARLTFAGLWTEADDNGNGIADADLLKGALWPKQHDVDASSIEAHLAELAGEHILLYEHDGERYFHIVNWLQHQAAAYRRGEPRYPSPPLHASACNLHTSARRGVLEGNEEGNRDTRAKRHLSDEAVDADFAAWWEIYPRKVAKQEALKSYRKARQSASAEQLASGLECSVNQWRRENRPPDKLPHATTWLNQRRWEDDYSATSNGLTPPPRRDHFGHEVSS